MNLFLSLFIGAGFLLSSPVFAYAASNNVVAQFTSNTLGVLITLASLGSAFFLIRGGFQYITSTGKPEELDSAKKTIRNALIGLVLVIAAGIFSSLLQNAFNTPSTGAATSTLALKPIQPVTPSNGLTQAMIDAATGFMQAIVQSATKPLVDGIISFLTTTPSLLNNSVVFNFWLVIVGIVDSLFAIVIALLGFHVMSTSTFGFDEIELKNLLPRIGLAMLSVSIGLLLKHLTIPELFILMAIEGSCFVFANIGRFSSIRFLVPNEQLHEAVAQDSVIEHFALMIGPSLGGFLYQTVGPVISFLVDAASYFINATALSLINSPLSVQHTLSGIGLKDGLKEAGTWLWNQRLYRLFILLSWTRTIVLAALPLFIIVLAKQLHATAVTIGIILAISAGAGIVGSIIGGKLARKYNRYNALVVTGVIYTFVFFLYVFASNIIILTVITAVLFAMLPSFYIITGGIAGTIPHHIQGRVTSITRSGDFISYSIGLFLIGFTLQFLGNMWTIIIFFSILLVFILITLCNKTLLSEIK